MTDGFIPSSLEIALVGAGGHAGVAAETARRSGLRVAWLYDRDPARIGATVGGAPVRLDDGACPLPMHAAIGDNGLRRAVVEARPGAVWRALVHPSADLADDVVVEEGALIAMGARVQASARILRHAIVNTGAIVEHDAIVGAFAHVAPGAILAGGVRLGTGALVGAGAVVLPGVHIGDGAVIGAGAVVTRGVEAGLTVAGAPAKPLFRDGGAA